MRPPRLEYWLVVLLMAVCTGCTSLSRNAINASPQIRIATYNVNYGNEAKELVQTLSQIDADILCLQEADNFEDAYRESLTNAFPNIYVRRSDANPGGGYAFLSKFPATEIAWIQPDDWFGAWLMRFETPTGPLQILNVHLHPPVKNGSWFQGYFLTRSDRLREIKAFYPYIKPNIPLIVVGDFNDTAQSRSMRFLKGKGMKNALPQFDRFSATWRWPLGPITLRRRMDHLVYSSELQCVGARVLAIGTSDHFPVIGNFTIAAHSPVK